MVKDEDDLPAATDCAPSALPGDLGRRQFLLGPPAMEEDRRREKFPARCPKGRVKPIAAITISWSSSHRISSSGSASASAMLPGDPAVGDAGGGAQHLPPTFRACHLVRSAGPPAGIWAGAAGVDLVVAYLNPQTLEEGPRTLERAATSSRTPRALPPEGREDITVLGGTLTAIYDAPMAIRASASCSNIIYVGARRPPSWKRRAGGLRSVGRRSVRGQGATDQAGTSGLAMGESDLVADHRPAIRRAERGRATASTSKSSRAAALGVGRGERLRLVSDHPLDLPGRGFHRPLRETPRGPEGGNDAAADGRSQGREDPPSGW